MARYIATKTIKQMATDLNVSEQVVDTFITTQRANGNIDKVLAALETAPGMSEAEIGTATGITVDVVTNVCKLLVYTRHIRAYA